MPISELLFFSTVSDRNWLLTLERNGAKVCYLRFSELCEDQAHVVPALLNVPLSSFLSVLAPCSTQHLKRLLSRQRGMFWTTYFFFLIIIF